jgi:tetratricopeptide (TPR) repeat protein
MTEFWLIIQQLDQTNSIVFVAGLMFVHLLITLIMSGILVAWLPFHYRRNWLWAFSMLFVVGLFTSELGLLFLFGGIHLAEWFPLEEEKDFGFTEIDLPEYSIYPWNTTHGSGLSGVRERISQQNLSPEIRIKSLMALQQSSTKVATGLINDLLSDSNDDIRLLAFGLLDQREKKLNRQITDLRKQLDALTIEEFEAKPALLRRLGELHWELVYEDLVQGDLRQFSLRQAESYIRKCLQASRTSDPITLFQLAKILNAAAQYPDALRTLQQAMDAGLSKSRAKPYLAEIAYNLRRYDLVHQVLWEMKGSPLTPRLRPLVDLWSQADYQKGRV